jgi:hypothetical protein
MPAHVARVLDSSLSSSLWCGKCVDQRCSDQTGGQEWRGDRRELLNLTADADAPEKCAQKCNMFSQCEGFSVSLEIGSCNLTSTLVIVCSPSLQHNYGTFT